MLLSFMLFSLSLLLVSVIADNNQKVLLETIKVLNFKKGTFTNARRSSPIPSISCVGGDACRDFIPEVVSCKNVGFDGNDIGWECTADLPNSVRFGTTDVSCEGFAYPEDPYILKGSCGLEYTLYRNVHGQRYYAQNGRTGTNFWSFFGVLFVAYIIWKFFVPSPQTPMNTSENPNSVGDGGGYGGGGFGGGGAGGPGGPGYGGGGAGAGYGRGNGGWTGSGYNNGAFGPNCAPQDQQNNGFWTGAGLGAMAGYLFGNRGGGGYYRAPPSYGSGFSSYGAGGSGTSFSSGSRSATGFGSTRRR